MRLAKNLDTKILCQVLFSIQIISPPLLVIAYIDERAQTDQHHGQTKPHEKLGTLEVLQYFALDDCFQHQLSKNHG